MDIGIEGSGTKGIAIEVNKQAVKVMFVCVLPFGIIGLYHILTDLR